jgi:hypothetical protein
MSELLGGIFSAGNRMKRKLGGLLSDPMGTIQLGNTRMGEDMNALSDLASEAGYMPNTVNRSDQSVMVSPEQNALARALLAQKGADMGMAGMTKKIWQGPPSAPASGMTREQAQRIVANEDYLPWDQVAAAKKVLGIAEEKASDIWAQMLAAKQLK